MLAAKLPRLETVEVVEEEVPTPGKGEVLIRMKASALCRSDLHRYHGTTIFDEEDEKSAYITPGHEPCGIVEEIGEGVTKVKKGDRVAIYLGLGCGTCPDCLRGDVMLCKEFKCIGFAVNGAHADFMTISEEKLFINAGKDGLHYRGIINRCRRNFIHCMQESGVKWHKKRSYYWMWSDGKWWNLNCKRIWCKSHRG